MANEVMKKQKFTLEEITHIVNQRPEISIKITPFEYNRFFEINSEKLTPEFLKLRNTALETYHEVTFNFLYPIPFLKNTFLNVNQDLAFRYTVYPQRNKTELHHIEGAGKINEDYGWEATAGTREISGSFKLIGEEADKYQVSHDNLLRVTNAECAFEEAIIDARLLFEKWLSKNHDLYQDNVCKLIEHFSELYNLDPIVDFANYYYRLELKQGIVGYEENFRTPLIICSNTTLALSDIQEEIIQKDGDFDWLIENENCRFSLEELVPITQDQYKNLLSCNIQEITIAEQDTDVEYLKDNQSYLYPLSTEQQHHLSVQKPDPTLVGSFFEATLTSNEAESMLMDLPQGKDFDPKKVYSLTLSPTYRFVFDITLDLDGKLVLDRMFHIPIKYCKDQNILELGQLDYESGSEAIFLKSQEIDANTDVSLQKELMTCDFFSADDGLDSLKKIAIHKMEEKALKAIKLWASDEDALPELIQKLSVEFKKYQ